MVVILHQNNLKRYLNEILYFEQTRFIQNTLINRLKMQIEQDSQIVKPQINFSMNKPIEPREPGRDLEGSILVVIGSIILFVVGAGVGFLVGFIIGYINYVASGWTYFNYSFLETASPIGAIIGLFIGVILVYYQAITIINDRNNYRYKMESYDNATNEFEESYAKAKKDASERANEINWKRQEIIVPTLSQQLNSTIKSRDHTDYTLSQLYDLNVIHPKYRNIVAVASFCEYIEAGRCTTLEGHEGAVNIYELEVRLDRIITKLDMILMSLNDIKENQFMLYTTINDGNKRISKLLDDTKVGLFTLSSAVTRTQLSIDENTRILKENMNHSALIGYNTDIIARNTHILADYCDYKRRNEL